MATTTSPATERELLDHRRRELLKALEQARQSEAQASLSYRTARELESVCASLDRLDRIESEAAAEAAKQERQRLFAEAQAELLAAWTEIRDLRDHYERMPNLIDLATRRHSAALRNFADRKAALEAL